MVLWLYLKALGKHWWELLSCALFTIVGIIAAFKNWSNGRVAIASIIVAALLLIVASFLAWKAQFDRAEALQVELANHKPRFVVTVYASHNVYNDQSDRTTLALAVKVLNKGAGSVIAATKVHYHSATLDMELPTGYLIEPMTGVVNGIRFSFSNEDSLSKYRSIPIARGSLGEGRVFVQLTGNRLAELNQSETKITVSAMDYLDEWQHGIYQGNPNPDGKVFAIPGEKAIAEPRVIHEAS